MATLAVKDLDAARKYYEDVLGFKPVGDSPGGVLYTAGSTSFLVYASEFAGTSRSTAISFEIPDAAFDSEAADLRSRGVSFDEFEMEGIEWNDGVASMGDGRAAWFTDPDGNILNIQASVGRPA
ncbi:VOC family protein [Actinotalea sp. M2MS4P-6]|uniref:VOC family protein n=1 Tax=Actinotalea sp. M2MS4P-6 TaxID=2983762 RepID=UPI0021E41DA5|nr:VOC family protein [Actinotalea sp. M2MS4P-6]MCV2395177.1 VOC family protein [Actinotalea sp. M2MS4P-6]